MKQQALGLIETIGLVAAIEAADAALKAAAVDLVTYEKVTGGLVTVAVTGEVAAVQAAIAAGSAAAARVGQVVSQHVIPRPMADIELLIRRSKTGSDEIGQETTQDNGVDDAETLSQVNGSEEVGQRPENAELEAMGVQDLRRLARKTEGIAIKGRQISKANKEELIEEIIRARQLK